MGAVVGLRGRSYAPLRLVRMTDRQKRLWQYVGLVVLAVAAGLAVVYAFQQPSSPLELKIPGMPR